VPVEDGAQLRFRVAGQYGSGVHAAVMDRRDAAEPAATLTPEPSAAPAVPEVVRYRPRDGWTNVSREAQVSVRFTVAMDWDSTQWAFRAAVDGVAGEGSYRWAEGGTVLVLEPAEVFPYGAGSSCRSTTRRGPRRGSSSRMHPR
jgi:hypothetical protein